MPVGGASASAGHRRGSSGACEWCAGSMPFRLDCRPAFDYARAPHERTVREGTAPASARQRLQPRRSSSHGAARRATAPACDGATSRSREGERPRSCCARSSAAARGPTAPTGRGQARGAVRGDGRATGGAGCAHAPTAGAGARSSTARRWCSSCSPSSRPGAIVAAPTCSLPEDARRRAQLGLPLHLDPRRGLHRSTRFLRIGFTEEAARFMDWLEQRCRELDGPTGRCRSCTAIDGRRDLTEETLDHLEGYRGSRPVRDRQRRRTASSSSTSTAS